MLHHHSMLIRRKLLLSVGRFIPQSSRRTVSCTVTALELNHLLLPLLDIAGFDEVLGPLSYKRLYTYSNRISTHDDHGSAFTFSTYDHDVVRRFFDINALPHRTDCLNRVSYRSKYNPKLMRISVLRLLCERIAGTDRCKRKTNRGKSVWRPRRVLLALLDRFTVSVADVVGGGRNGAMSPHLKMVRGIVVVATHGVTEEGPASPFRIKIQRAFGGTHYRITYDFGVTGAKAIIQGDSSIIWLPYVISH